MSIQMSILKSSIHNVGHNNKPASLVSIKPTAEQKNDQSFIRLQSRLQIVMNSN